VASSFVPGKSTIGASFNTFWVFTVAASNDFTTAMIGIVFNNNAGPGWIKFVKVPY
jgi:hypothetical protein